MSYYSPYKMCMCYYYMYRCRICVTVTYIIISHVSL